MRIAIDVKKCLYSAFLPAAILIVVGFINHFLNQTFPSAGYLIGAPTWIFTIIVLAWSGYRVVKEQGMDFKGGTITGMLAGSIDLLVSGGIVGMVMAYSSHNLNNAKEIAVFGLSVMLMIVIAVIFGAVLGAVCGAIGAYIAGMKK